MPSSSTITINGGQTKWRKASELVRIGTCVASRLPFDDAQPTEV
jgi:hypothetical protein